MALTETEQSVAFTFKEFTTSLKQEFDISLTASTKENFTNAINRLSLGDMSIKVNDAKNAGEIRKINTELKNIDQELKNIQYLKPKNCNCDCNPAAADTTISRVK